MRHACTVVEVHADHRVGPFDGSDGRTAPHAALSDAHAQTDGSLSARLQCEIGSVDHLKVGESYMDLANQLMEDIELLKEFHQQGSGWAPNVEITPNTMVDEDKALVDIELVVQ